ncbi:Cytoplasmic 60S subunit biogenesis factor REI1-like protein [Lasiodiplodia hormozganensis]|uniref:Cytoplasmic 60S subunit biogenesis factor REI1-like protein n=1 Tax=Lasiodiplodia hormozganensis TaxID=869390 RepID=A0AA40CM61_9PEZI|nr:Cytoplasmic 60S subunit biogenesis factor REI1-like protein [Lasiodiplodia hormozganensis]
MASAFTCSTCASAFDGAHNEQRVHVRDPWHQYNLQRRMASLPPITLQQYEVIVQPEQASPEHKKKSTNRKPPKDYGKQKQAARNEQSPSPSVSDDSGTKGEDHDAYNLSAPSSDLDEDSDEQDEEEEPVALTPTTCLFCNATSPTLDANLSHMSTTHSLFIPEPGSLIDLETFLLYLAAIVFRYHECLYCGAAKSSAAAAQTHMRDKGHCMINLASADCELLDFWEFDEDEEGGGAGGAAAAASVLSSVNVSDTEMRLPSGAIVGSRHHAESVHNRHGLVGARVQAAKRRKAIADNEHDAAADTDGGEADPRPQPKSMDCRVAVRGEMGLVGVPEQQRRALMAVEKKMMKREAVARAAQRWATEKVANRQKFFKPDVPGRKNG